MSKVLQSVDSRTNLVGQNRLELLMFRLLTNQTYAINVFKVQEVLTLPKLTTIPGSNPVVIGVIYLRGRPLPVIDLSLAIGCPAQKIDVTSNIIVTEYNSTVQAFLVTGIRRIVNLNWEEILPVPTGSGDKHYLTAVSKYEEEIIEIIDVEKVLAEVQPHSMEISEGVVKENLKSQLMEKEVLVIDDSSTARMQVKTIMTALGLKVHLARNGLEGLQMLQGWLDEGLNIYDKLLLVVTDAEMPTMDGYSLTTEIRSDERMKDLFVALHTSLSGNFNEAMVKKVGCNAFLSKFEPDELAKLVQSRLEPDN
ncbi:MAG: chemotaxis protein CheV [Saccharospirillaceae bacterium]|nr:chemotaxis protein CheV [Pseudomonadales bacterium]NRB79065.1 chemotaxis protein CheV [Saccharospirillaceae bacterium]